MANERKSAVERGQDRALLRDAAPAVAALVVSEAVVAWVDLDVDRHGWHLAVALLPLLAGVWLAWVQVRALRRCDEYQRVVQLEALAVGFAVAMLVAMAGGLLSAVDVGSDALYLQLTFILGVLSWVGAMALGSRR